MFVEEIDNLGRKVLSVFGGCDKLAPNKVGVHADRKGPPAKGNDSLDVFHFLEVFKLPRTCR